MDVGVFPWDGHADPFNKCERLTLTALSDDEKLVLAAVLRVMMFGGILKAKPKNDRGLTYKSFGGKVRK